MADSDSYSLSVSPFRTVKTAGRGVGRKSGCQPPLWLDIVSPAQCALCGRLGNALCSACVGQLAPIWRKEGSVWYLGRYEDDWQRLVQGWKFGGLSRAPQAVVEAAGPLLFVEPGSILVPAPQSRWRFASRGYNQAELLAGWLAQLADARVALLLTDQWRRTQTHLAGRREDRQSSRGLRPSRAARASVGRPVWLVDDVVTTGGTLREMGGLLTAAGLTVRGSIVLCLCPKRYP